MNLIIRICLVWLMWLLPVAKAASLTGNLKLEPKNGVLQAELRFEQKLTNQLLVWMWRPGQDGWKERRGLPIEPILEGEKTIYRFNTPVRQAGQWYIRTTLGAGQAAYIGFSQPFIDPKDSSSSFVFLQNSFADTVPTYVQPVGYAVYALVALFAIGLTAIVLRRLEQRKA
jgi:hypothetical protein